MPVGTRGAVKAVTQRDLEDLGAEIILGNTYHLYLQTGRRADRAVRRAAPVHGWDRPILTDSGGYQVFSLAAMRQDPRGRRGVPVASRRIAAHADAGEGGRHPAAARIRHRHGARRMRRVGPAAPQPARSGAGAGPSGSDGAVGPLGAAGAGAAAAAAARPGIRARRDRDQPRPGAVRHHPGRHVAGAADRERPGRRSRSGSRRTRSAG